MTAKTGLVKLVKAIKDPERSIVQRDVKTDSVKVLIVKTDNAQSIVTFDIPPEPCTVKDLLEVVGIPSFKNLDISLVTDETWNINYIVECKSTVADSWNNFVINPLLGAKSGIKSNYAEHCALLKKMQASYLARGIKAKCPAVTATKNDKEKKSPPKKTPKNGAQKKFKVKVRIGRRLRPTADRRLTSLARRKFRRGQLFLLRRALRPLVGTPKYAEVLRAVCRCSSVNFNVSFNIP